MRKIKHIANILLCLSLMVAGFPVHADQQCLGHGIAHHHETQHADAQSHHDHNKTHSDHANCCLNGSASAILLNNTFTLSRHTEKTEKLNTAEQVLVSRLLQVQDRPPKLFS